MRWRERRALRQCRAHHTAGTGRRRSTAPGRRRRWRSSGRRRSTRRARSSRRGWSARTSSVNAPRSGPHRHLEAGGAGLERGGITSPSGNSSWSLSRLTRTTGSGWTGWSGSRDVARPRRERDAEPSGSVTAPETDSSAALTRSNRGAVLVGGAGARAQQQRFCRTRPAPGRRSARRARTAAGHRSGAATERRSSVL